MAEEHLADWRSGVLAGDDSEIRERMIEFNQREVRKLRLAHLFSEPFLTTDRPGRQTVQSRLSLDNNAFPRATRMHLPTPVAGHSGSWTAIAAEAAADHFTRWPWVPEIAAGEPMMVDIAIGEEGWNCFDDTRPVLRQGSG